MSRNFWLALLLVAGCTTAGRTAVSTPPADAPPPPPLNVTAVVDKIERNGYQDFITDGSVISWTLVTFYVGSPEVPFGTAVRVYCTGHPYLEGGPLLIGQLVTFDLPDSPKRDGLPLEELKNLARRK